MIDNELLAEFIDLTIQQRESKERTKDLGARIADMENKLLDDFQDSGTQKISTTSGHTVYLRRQILPSVAAGQMPALCEAMVSLGHGSMVKESVHVGSLGAWVREFDEGDDGLPQLPEEIRPLVNVYEKFGLRVTKA